MVDLSKVEVTRGKGEDEKGYYSVKGDGKVFVSNKVESNPTLFFTADGEEDPWDGDVG